MQDVYKRQALKSVLSAKAAEGKIIVVDNIAMEAPKTREFVAFLNAVNAENKACLLYTSRCV